MRRLACLALPALLAAQTPPEAVTRLEGFKDVFRQGPVFVSGQPSLELLRALKGEGVTLVVNLRSEKEVREHAATGFQEEALVRELGMAYIAIPLGEKGTYAPAAVERLEQARRARPGKVLIHCASGGRATLLHMAYQVRVAGLSLDEAAAAGRQMAFTFPLEDLLGTRVAFSATR